MIFTRDGPENIFGFKEVSLGMFHRKCIQNFISDLKGIPALKGKIEAKKALGF
jgi:hypothetical protein